VLAVLRQHHVKATFCIIGKMAQTYPERIREIVRDGHTLCNHTFDHDFMLGRRTEAEIRANLQRANDAIHAAAPDAKIAYFRQPGGNWTPRVVKVAADMGMTSIHWAVDPQDWSRPGTTTITNIVISRTRAGSIVLMHDGGGDRSQTVAALRTILPNLASRFQLIPLPVPDLTDG
jgi:peptidoglycan/xylan/chitin deacetylase (PgdA/CDA1 family)